jgi:hypothetical protein
MDELAVAPHNGCARYRGLQSITKLPTVVKGVQTVEHGASGVILFLSNHGGGQPTMTKDVLLIGVLGLHRWMAPDIPRSRMGAGRGSQLRTGRGERGQGE